MTSHKHLAPPPPLKGDKLFRGDLRDWKNNACLRNGDEYAYREGYRRGAQILVRAVEETQSDQDFLVYPIVFLYRHHIELALKRVIKRAAPRWLARIPGLAPWATIWRRFAAAGGAPAPVVRVISARE